MANISDSFGDVYITAPTYLDTVKIAKIITKYLGDSDYCTIINSNKAMVDYADEDYCRTIFPFVGTGRWAYINNIEYLGTWLESDIEFKNENNVIEYLENIDWELNFEYSDYEPSCLVLGSGYATVIHKKGQKLSKSQFIDEGWDDKEMTYFNIMTVMKYDLDDLSQDRSFYEYIDRGLEIDDELVEEVERFVSDFAEYKSMSYQKAKQTIASLSSDFKELFELIDEGEGYEIFVCKISS